MVQQRSDAVRVQQVLEQGCYGTEHEWVSSCQGAAKGLVNRCI